jgi:hypothetical protein
VGIIWGLKSTVFWVATQCISEKPRRFEGTFLFHHQSKIVSEARNQEGAQRVVLSARSYLVYCLAYSLNLKMEAICSSKTSGRYSPDDRILHSYHCENLKSISRRILSL